MDEGSKPPEQTPSLPPVAHKLVPTAEKSNFPPPPVTMSHRENFPTHVPSSSKSDPKGDNVLQISPTVHTTPKPNALPEMAITPTIAHQASDDSTRSGGQESSDSRVIIWVSLLVGLHILRCVAIKVCT